MPGSRQCPDSSRAATRSRRSFRASMRLSCPTYGCAPATTSTRSSSSSRPSPTPSKSDRIRKPPRPIPNNTLATELTDDEIEKLSDDPNEMMRQLVEMAGGAARVRIDGFNGGSLPSRDVIRSMRIVRDTFPAENHSAENDGIDIITQAGIGPIRGGFSTRVRDSVFSGDNPFVDVKAPERTQNFDVNLGGAIKPNKSSFSMFFSGRKQFDTPVATYVTLDGKTSTLLGRRPNDGWNVNGMFDYTLTKEQMLRVGYSQNYSTRSNLGIGGFDLAERAYSNENSSNQVRVQETGPIRPEHVPEYAAAAAPLSQRFHVAARGADHPRARRRHARRRAGRRRRQPEGHRAVVGSELRARHPHHAHRHRARGPPLSHRQRVELSRHLHLLERRDFPDRQAAQLHAAHRRSADRLFASRSRGLRAGRYAAAAEPDLQSRPALRNADARARSDRLRSAARPDVGARQERPHDHPHQLRHLLQLARHERLRADAARRRRPPAGNQHRESDVPRSRRRRDDQREQQVRARRHQDGAHPPLQRRRSIAPSRRRCAPACPSRWRATTISCAA